MLKRVFMLILSMLVIGNLSGCIFLAAKIVEESEKAERDFNVPSGKVLEATKSAFASLNLELGEAVTGENEIKIKGKYSDGREVQIEILNINNTASKVKVQVGRVDKSSAERVLEAISQQLNY
ncbi:MAG: DUF3568 family protein [Candidatus Omnitrophica bacterium]|nr:DUF3568 family protein [Candidatus Omnitrophota bacterium]